MNNQTLREEIDLIISGICPDYPLRGEKVDQIANLFDEVLVELRMEMREPVDYPKGINGDAWHYGWDEGYNSAAEEQNDKITKVRESLNERRKS